MIEVKIVLDSFGLGVQRKDLATITIVNDGSGTPLRGNYIVTRYASNGRELESARVENWPRKSKTPVDLLAKALSALGYRI
jgi:hypothetical protein